MINGPNLNLLGEREPGIYGDDTYESLCEMIMDKADEMNIKCEIFQSNHEGAIIDKLHSARMNFNGVILNAGAYTHYSYAIRDAISAISIPVVEVHISNVLQEMNSEKFCYCSCVQGKYFWLWIFFLFSGNGCIGEVLWIELSSLYSLKSPTVR